jgi:hypothetical protein
MALGSTQPLTEMSTRNIPGGEGRPARKAHNITAICVPIIYKNVGASTSHSPMGLHGPLPRYPYLSLSLYLIHNLAKVFYQNKNIYLRKTFMSIFLLCLIYLNCHRNYRLEITVYQFTVKD